MNAAVEVIRAGVRATGARVALFDFDGTLSLIRSNWMDVMVPMMIAILRETKTAETEEQLRAVVEDFVWRLTGQETIYQMIELANQVRERGGEPKEPLAYKYQYLDLLWEKIRSRVESLRAGSAKASDYLVPGSIGLLEALRSRGFKLFLASGTDEAYMKAEADLLDVTKYFDGGVYGALDDYKSFSKGILIRRILDSDEFHGHEFLAFGDGYVEIEEIKKVGGVAVGVATHEPECKIVDEWKRTRLIGAGADIVVPNYEKLDELLGVLFP